MTGMDTNRACQRLFCPFLEMVWNQAVGTSLEPSVRLLGTSAVLVFRYDFERQDLVKWYDAGNQNNLSIPAFVRACRPPGMGLVAAQMWSWIGNLLSGLIYLLQISSLATLPWFRFMMFCGIVMFLWAHLRNLEVFIDFMACCLHPHEFDSNALQRWEKREQQRIQPWQLLQTFEQDLRLKHKLLNATTKCRCDNKTAPEQSGDGVEHVEVWTYMPVISHVRQSFCLTAKPHMTCAQ